MAALTNQRHEQFVQQLSKGLSATRAYVSVYGESKGAAQMASRLLRNVEVCSRLIELKKEVNTGFVDAEIQHRNARVQALQNRWDRMRRLIEARSQDMAAEVAGGETGLLVRDYKGKDANQVVYKFDAALVNELNKCEKQAAEELGQWVTKTETTVIDIAEIIERLNAGRKRAAEAWEAQNLLTASVTSVP
jgi:hypothetical protein